MKTLRLLYVWPIGLCALVLLIVVSLVADAIELRKKQKLGADYEGPLADE